MVACRQKYLNKIWTKKWVFEEITDVESYQSENGASSF